MQIVSWDFLDASFLSCCQKGIFETPKSRKNPKFRFTMGKYSKIQDIAISEQSFLEPTI